MKIAIISKYIYPYRTPRALRATELAKELVRQGHEVHLYGILNGFDYDSFTRATGVEVRDLGVYQYDRIVANKGVRQFVATAVAAKFGKLLNWPDRQMIPLVKDALAKEVPLDCLITIAAPHIIPYAASLCDLSNVKCWIADSGDPWTLNPFVRFPRYYERMERQWCERCNYITVPIEDAKEGYYPEYRDKICVIPQGFNFDEVQIEEYEKNAIPTFVYAGTVYNNGRNPKLFLERLIEMTEDFRFYIYGNSEAFFRPYVEKCPQKIIFVGSVDRIELIRRMSEADFLVNVANNSGVQQPSKLIDYTLSKRPILTISPDFEKNDMAHFREFLSGEYKNATELCNLDQYNISKVAAKFLSLTEQIR